MLRISIGGSAGFKIIIAFPFSAPPTTSTPFAVVWVNSSMLALVPGPADFEATEETISEYLTFATLLTAAVGLYFVRLQGISTLYSAANTIRNNQEPLREVFNGFCLAIAAILLIIPGFFTDAIGVLLLIPFSSHFF